MFKLEGVKPKIKLCTPFFWLLLVFFTFGPFLTNTAQASTLSDLQKQRQQLQSQIEQNQKAAQQKQQEADNLNKIINQLSGNIDQTQTKITQTQVQINQTQKDIESTASDIRQKEGELKVQNDNLNMTLVDMYEIANRSTLDLVLGSENISSVISYTDYLDTLEMKVENDIAKIEKIKSDLEGQKKQLEDRSAQLQALQKNQRNYEKTLQGQKSQKTTALNTAGAVMADLQAKIDEAKKYGAQLDSQIANIIASQRKAVNVRDKGTSTVGLSWPCDYIYISQYFGEPWNFNPSTPHTGIDLVNAMGTPIYASAGGTVYIGSQGSMGYGNYIIIYHNARFATLYGHLSSMTALTSQEVSSSQLIGYMGSTGWSTGPHLHFEVWEYGNRVNPLNYLP
ncbi:MAG: hypothetical protein COX39_00820 [Candidatus Nealsonbacteria bacterium CG23_combo_of_CG06-09_8_20_14_all_40_13]|uniref:M23ase beta-sheet core domain-containing protein n=1 Tax=Candidatus Nealsonbacteria bacterium CG23_combo_of_CG06-09_8_20_14_all_40_13 TaxID=1974724 RepID=A0A2G9YRG0_9BACT|nr:MAG: hypothetical protein COX39_00820 [Candidatus Nealsonbacteria bacterium CG23_combo_of_CG06-09_8_20_14_all_40_13]